MIERKTTYGTCSGCKSDKVIVQKTLNLCAGCNQKRWPMKRSTIKPKSPKRTPYKGISMPNHTKVYLSELGVSPEDAHTLPCEFGCGNVQDIHHIDPRGMGGDPTGSKDSILNLMGCCRQSHRDCEEGRIPIEEQIRIHKDFLTSKGISYPDI